MVEEAQQQQVESKVSPQFEAEVAVLLVAQVAEVQPFVQVAAVV